MYSLTNYDAEIQFKSSQLWPPAREQQQGRRKRGQGRLSPRQILTGTESKSIPSQGRIFRPSCGPEQFI